MVFSSITFLFYFFPLVLLVHFLTPRDFRNAFLLLVSLFFYAWGETFFVLVMFVSVTANFLFGKWLKQTEEHPGARKGVVTLAVALNLGLLIAYKYANFIVENVNVVLSAVHLPTIGLAPVHLPIGISFFTFQALSYVVDVYRRQVPAEDRFVNVALYISLFPQLIAGPIIRYRDVAKQIVRRTVQSSDFAYGIRRFIVGLGKKVLIANTVGEQVDRIQAITPGQIPTEMAWLADFYFVLQLYFDFSGYSDMAIGLGHMFGFRFRENFNYPYISKTLTEFWQRWHISLSTWFRDYLFVSMGGYRINRARAYCNLMIVFFLCGLWHGASWNFVLFGVFQGFILLIERIVRVRRIRILQGPLGNLYCITLFFITSALFRCESLHATRAFFGSMLGYVPHATGEYHIGMYINTELVLVSLAGVVGSTPFIPWLRDRIRGLTNRIGEETPTGIALELSRQVVCLALLIGIFVLCTMKLAAGTHNPFIYFRF